MPDTPERRPSDVAPGATRATEPAIQGNRPDAAGSKSGQRGRASRAAHETTEQVKHQAGRWADEAKNLGRRVLDEQKGNAAHQLAGIAQVLHQSAEQCKEREDQRVAASVLDQAAGALDRLSDAIRSRDLDSMLDQATNLMRRQPALFVGGTVLAGFLLSRFATSSSHGSQHSYEQDGGDAYTGSAGDSRAGGAGRSYVTSAHVDPREVAGGRGAAPPVTPTGRRDY